MPFITEELWHAVYDGQPAGQVDRALAVSAGRSGQMDADAETAMAILQDLIVSVRNVRAELKVEQKQKVAIEVFAASEDGSFHAGAQSQRGGTAGECRSHYVRRQSLAKASGARSTARFDVRVIYERKIDVAAERDRLTKELEKLTERSWREQPRS
jgi:valyl-tRNA synthetase